MYTINQLLHLKKLKNLIWLSRVRLILVNRTTSFLSLLIMRQYHLQEISVRHIILFGIKRKF